MALDGLGATPYYYDLIEKKDEATSTSLTYKGESAAAIVTKQFIMHHASYTILI